MKFLVDAQLPRRVASWLDRQGYDAIHTLDLPEANRTADVTITALAGREDRIVVTKDADFVDSHVLQHKPAKLLLIATGNISNGDLEAILLTNLDGIVSAFKSTDFVEVTRSEIILHT